MEWAGLLHDLLCIELANAIPQIDGQTNLVVQIDYKIIPHLKADLVVQDKRVVSKTQLI